jgi:hypothetical protein
MRLKLAFSLIVALITVLNIVNAQNADFEIKTIYFNQTRLQLGSETINNAKIFYSPNGYFLFVVHSSSNYINVYRYFLENDTLERVMRFYFTPTYLLYGLSYSATLKNSLYKYQDGFLIMRSDGKTPYVFGLDATDGNWEGPYQPYGSFSYYSAFLIDKNSGLYSYNVSYSGRNYWLVVYPSGANHPTNNWVVLPRYYDFSTGEAGSGTGYTVTFGSNLYESSAYGKFVSHFIIMILLTHLD